jgi:hypothetical protein
MTLLSRLARWWSGTVMRDLRRELPVIARHQREVGAVRDINGTVIAWTAGLAQVPAECQALPVEYKETR